MKLTENTKENIKSTYEIVRGLILMIIVIVLGLAITTGTADAKMVVGVDKSVKPSERREWGVKSIDVDKSFSVDKYCSEYRNSKKYDACMKRIKSSIDKRYEMLDRAWSKK